jgi:Uma2 family endonuclease
VAYNTARPIPPLTVDEYLRLEDESSLRHEYVAGELYALAGATRRHNRIAGNIFARLWEAAGDGPCRIYQSDVKLRVGDDAFYYPAVQVVCDPDDVEEAYTSAPCVVVEVLSPSTESIDRREKRLAYRRLESLKAYVIVYRDEMRVMRHWRDDHGTWWDAEVAGEGKVPFPCPQIELTLADIYRGLGPVSR